MPEIGPVNIEEIRRRASRNREADTSFKETLNTNFGKVELLPFKAGKYSVLEILIQLHDFHNASLEQPLIYDEVAHKKIEAAQNYRALNSTIVSQLMVGGKNRIEEMAKNLVKVSAAIGTIGGLESVLLTTVSGLSHFNKSTDILGDLFIPFGRSNQLTDFAAGHDLSYFFDFRSNGLMEFGRTGFFNSVNMTSREGMQQSLSEVNNSNYSPARREACIAKYSAVGATVGVVAGDYVGGGWAGAGVLGALGAKWGDWYGKKNCPKLESSTPNNDDNGGAQIPNGEGEPTKLELDEKTKEDIERKKKETGCYADVPNDYLNVDPYLTADRQTFSSRLPKFELMSNIIQKEAGKFVFNNLPSLELNIENFTSQNFNTLDLGFMAFDSKLTNNFETVKDKLLNASKKFKNADLSNIKQLGYKGKVLAASGQEINLEIKIKKIINELSKDEINEIEQKITAIGETNEERYLQIGAQTANINIPNEDPTLPGKQATISKRMYLVSTKSHAVKNIIGNSGVIVSEDNLIKTIENIRRLEALMLPIDGVSTFLDD